MAVSAMANPEHEAILNQGVAVWNQWRLDNPAIKPNLQNVYIGKRAYFEADLSYTNLMGASLSYTSLGGANLTGANLTGAQLRHTFLMTDDLSHANLTGANLSYAQLAGAKLNHANLKEAIFNGRNFEDTDFEGAVCNLTVFINIDLSKTRGLDKVIHKKHSSIGVDTLSKSKGKIPESFLRGCGLSEKLILLLPALLE